MTTSSDQQQDQRQEYRLSSSETVYIEVGGEAGAETAILLSHATDLSANGLQVVLDQLLPVGHIYSLCIQLIEPNVRFVLAGEVKWCRIEDGRFRVGIALFESDDTAIVDWKQEMARRLE